MVPKYYLVENDYYRNILHTVLFGFEVDWAQWEFRAQFLMVIIVWSKLVWHSGRISPFILMLKLSAWLFFGFSDLKRPSNLKIYANPIHSTQIQLLCQHCSEFCPSPPSAGMFLCNSKPSNGSKSMNVSVMTWMLCVLERVVKWEVVQGPPAYTTQTGEKEPTSLNLVWKRLFIYCN